MNTFTHVPPGFRFHPTDEELVDYYLRRKVSSRHIDLDVIKDIDLYKIEPWDLQELCRIGTEELNEWYFFSHKDKKYPTGTRTNRATEAGFWKATGRDKAIYSKHDDLIGMRKTLVFYKGRAPNGQKSDWIMHEYRLETDEHEAPQEEGWVVCRAFKKRVASTQRLSEHGSPIWYDDHVTFMPELDSNINPNYTTFCKKETISLQYGSLLPPHHNHLLQLPLSESCPKVLNSIPSFEGTSFQTSKINSVEQLVHQTLDQDNFQLMSEDDQVTDWRVLDKFVASQLSRQGGSVVFPEKQDAKISSDNASTSSSGCQNIDLWKS